MSLICKTELRRRKMVRRELAKVQMHNTTTEELVTEKSVLVTVL